MIRLKLTTIFALLLAACSGGPADDGGDNGAGVPPPAQDAKIYVATVEALNARALVAGDTVVLADGSYSSKIVDIKATGSSSKPIVIKAASAGGVVFTGSSKLKFSGSHLVFEGFYFKDVVSTSGAIIEFRRNSTDLASHCLVRSCAISGRNTSADKTTDYKWISLFGTNNSVEGCSFVDKKNIGTLMVVWLGDKTVSHTIKNNYFSRPTILLDANGKEMNGQETIRIGDSSSSMLNAGCLVEGNVFDRCDAEIEAISSKSCFNTYRGNLFERCAATLTLRHGNDCLVEDNIFSGQGVANSGGVRIIGERHRVKGNYFENLKGINLRSAISLMRGVPNSVLSGYFQVKSAVVEGNTIVNCVDGIHANYDSSSDQTLPVVLSTVKNNVISNNADGNYSVQVQESTPVADIFWSTNTIFGGRQKGIKLATTTTKPIIVSRTERIASIKSSAGVAWAMK